MASGDVIGPVLAFVTRPGTSRAARLQGLNILADLAESRGAPGTARRIAPLLADTSTAVRCAVLRVMAAEGDTGVMHLIADRFLACTDTSERARAADALAGCFDSFQPGLDGAVTRHDTAAVDSVVNAVHSVPGPKLGIYVAAVKAYGRLGDTARVRKVQELMGGEIPWYFVGPFPLDRIHQWSQEHGPETHPFNQSEQFRTMGDRAQAWSPVRERDPTGQMHINATIPARSCMYLCAQVRCPNACDAFVMLSPQEGVNELLVRVDRYLGEITFGCRLTGLDGNAMADVGFGGER
jgi:hypothetical protein